MSLDETLEVATLEYVSSLAEVEALRGALARKEAQHWHKVRALDDARLAVKKAEREGDERRC